MFSVSQSLFLSLGIQQYTKILREEGFKKKSMEEGMGWELYIKEVRQVSIRTEIRENTKASHVDI